MVMMALDLVFPFKIFVAFWLIQNSLFTDAAIMKFTNYKCENVNTSIVAVHQCRLKAVKRDVVTLNFNATLLERAHKIHIVGGLFKRANGYKPWLYKIDLDVCRFLRKAYNPIALVLVGDVLRFSNLNHSCPYEGLVFVQGFYLRPEVARLPFPTGDYLVETKWYINQELAGVAKYYFTFVEDL